MARRAGIRDGRIRSNPSDVARPLSASEAAYQRSFELRYGFAPPPRWTELSDYDALLDVIVERQLFELDGDVVEIGAFLGGGTFKLSKLLERLAPRKTVVSVDLFDLDFDATRRVTDAAPMASLYRQRLGSRSQRDVFQMVTAPCRNLVVVEADSMHCELPIDRVCFAYIDGCHRPTHVRNDFHLAWSRAVPGAVIAFDDYGFDLPDVTATIDEILGRTRTEIAEAWTVPPKTLFVAKAGRA